MLTLALLGLVRLRIRAVAESCCGDDMADLHGTDCVSEDSASDYTLVLGKI